MVNAALGKERLLPARAPADLATLLREMLALQILDGTGRPVRRPQNPDRRRADDSGKQKARRKKTLPATGGEGHVRRADRAEEASGPRA